MSERGKSEKRKRMRKKIRIENNIKERGKKIIKKKVFIKETDIGKGQRFPGERGEVNMF